MPPPFVLVLQLKFAFGCVVFGGVGDVGVSGSVVEVMRRGAEERDNGKEER